MCVSRGLHCLLALTFLFSGVTHALDPRADIARAVELVEQQQYSLARTYIAPALIAPSITSGERSRAYYLRGFSFLAQGMAVSARKDFNRALEFNPANPAALVELARLYQAGKGIARDVEVAFQLFDQAAQLDYPPAQFHIGFAHLAGEGVEKNLVKARELLTVAAEGGHVYAMLSLAASYRQEHAEPPEPAVAEEWYRKAAEAGAARAWISLGYMHQNGELGAVDHARAVELFEQAAAAGEPAAQISLAYAYLHGRGVDEDTGRAYQLYRTAAEQNEPGSFVALGHLYQHGIGVEQDLDQARDWFEKGAGLGLVEAQLRLVGMLLGSESEESRKRALYWSGQAAKSGTPRARNDYAWMLATSKFAEIRNGTLAVDQATKAVAVTPSAAYLDTLAAAYAESGDFLQAIETQHQALDALKEDEAAIRGELETRLAHYRRSEPWRE